MAQEFPDLRLLGLADCITMLNLASGIGTIFLCLNYLENEHNEFYIYFAFILIPFSLICDFLDGYVARRTYSSPFGKDLDSLADLISFGVCPSCLGFTLGLRGFWDSLIMCSFVICCMLRLARFNVRSRNLGEKKSKVSYYQGLPTPFSVLIGLILFIAYLSGSVHSTNMWGGEYKIFPGYFHPLSLVYLVLGSLMVSMVKIKKL